MFSVRRCQCLAVWATWQNIKRAQNHNGINSPYIPKCCMLIIINNNYSCKVFCNVGSDCGYFACKYDIDVVPMKSTGSTHNIRRSNQFLPSYNFLIFTFFTPMSHLMNFIHLTFPWIAFAIAFEMNECIKNIVYNRNRYKMISMNTPFSL